MQKIIKKLVFIGILLILILILNNKVNAVSDNIPLDSSNLNANITNTSENNIYNFTGTTNQSQTPYTPNESSSNSSVNILSSLPEVKDLGLANVLNILLIVVGVIIILLAFAILVRLKKS